MRTPDETKLTLHKLYPFQHDGRANRHDAAPCKLSLHEQRVFIFAPGVLRATYDNKAAFQFRQSVSGSPRVHSLHHVTTNNPLSRTIPTLNRTSGLQTRRSMIRSICVASNGGCWARPRFIRTSVKGHFSLGVSDRSRCFVMKAAIRLDGDNTRRIDKYTREQITAHR